MDLTFRIIAEQEYQLLKTWFDDAEMEQRLSFPTDQWFDYVRQTPGTYAWMIFDADMPVGYVQLGIEEDKRAYLAFGVKAEWRGKGYGRRILQALVNRPEVAGLASIEGGIQADNISSQRCVIAAGFRAQSETPDADGFINYIYCREQ
jgi:RimJ/RimL family protein N-acetyltransferase